MYPPLPDLLLPDMPFSVYKIRVNLLILLKPILLSQGHPESGSQVRQAGSSLGHGRERLSQFRILGQSAGWKTSRPRHLSFKTEFRPLTPGCLPQPPCSHKAVFVEERRGSSVEHAPLAPGSRGLVEHA